MSDLEWMACRVSSEWLFKLEFVWLRLWSLRMTVFRTWSTGFAYLYEPWLLNRLSSVRNDSKLQRVSSGETLICYQMGKHLFRWRMNNMDEQMRLIVMVQWRQWCWTCRYNCTSQTSKFDAQMQSKKTVHYAEKSLSPQHYRNFMRLKRTSGIDLDLHRIVRSNWKLVTKHLKRLGFNLH